MSIEVRLPPDPCSVGEARSLTLQQVLAVGRDDLADDCVLAVSELVCNAVLHARTGLTLRIDAVPSLVRCEVEDGSDELPLLHAPNESTISGRGLSLVHCVTGGRWGAEASPGGGKIVWFEMSASCAPDASASEQDLLALWADQDDQELVAVPARDALEVVLLDVDSALLLTARDHSDDLVRELTLLLLNTEARVTERRDDPRMVRLARRLDAAAEEFDSARRQLREAAAHAVAEGHSRIDVRLTLHVEDVEAVQRYSEAIEEADALCSDGGMLLNPGPPTVLAYRRWYLQEIEDQLRRSRRAAHPPSTSGPTEREPRP